MLRRITWSSVLSPEFSPARLNEIIAPARRNNERDQITGMLLFNGRQFLAIQEGEERALDKLWLRLAADVRHRELFGIGDERCGKHWFSNWMMGYTEDPGMGTQIDAIQLLQKQIERQAVTLDRRTRTPAFAQARPAAPWSTMFYPMMVSADSM